MSKLNFITPFFIVSNLKDSVSFYVNKLGFEVWYTGPDDDPYWAMVGRGPVSIMLKAIADDIKPIPNHTRHEWAPWDAYISIEEPDALFEEFSLNGIAFRQPLGDNSDGLRGFEVTDVDGYVLFFGRPKA
jgi:catechol 2,3-dioxygenase-like lactoylglutathione lyase family enzyme